MIVELTMDAVPGAAVVFDRSYRGVLDLVGKDVSGVMNRVFSSAVTSVVPSQGQLSTLLSSRGRIIAGFQLFRLEAEGVSHHWSTAPSSAGGDDCAGGARCPSGAEEGEGALRLVFLEPLRESVVNGISKYAFLSDITLLDRTSEVAILSVEGRKAAQVLQPLLGRSTLPRLLLGLVRGTIAEVPVTVVRFGESPEGGFDVWVPRSSLARVRGLLESNAREVGGGPGCPAEAEALRIEAGIAHHGRDYDEENFPNDAGWEPALTYDKCYVGQEIVARMRTYGQANRRLAGVVFPPGASSQVPASLLVGGEEAGCVSSVAPSARLGRTVGLAMVKRKFWEARSGTVLGAMGSVEVEIVPLPIVRLDSAEAS